MNTHMVTDTYAIHDPSPTYFEWEALMAATVKIEDGKGDYIVINAVDFDPAKHVKYGEKSTKAAPKKKAAKKAK